MTIINNGSLKDLLTAANTGPFMQAEIISLTGKGKLRVTCNWMYSALNCDPNDNSTFLWQFSKVDDQHISLSPVNSCISKTIYASVRDDYNYYVQVQAPFSADWIIAAARDEVINFHPLSITVAQLKGFNNKFISLNATPDCQGGHTGFRVRSIGETFDINAQWFIAIKSSLQSHIQFSGVDNSIESVQKQLAEVNISIDSSILEQVVLQLNQ
jgi:hypothetical protein